MIKDQLLIPSNELIDEVHVGRGDFRAIGEGLANLPFHKDGLVRMILSWILVVALVE